MDSEIDRTGYTLTTTPEYVVYTLYDSRNGAALIQLSYTAEQAETIGSELILAAAAVRMTQENGDDQPNA